MQHGDYLIVGVHARMDMSASARDLVETIARCKEALRANFPNAAWVFFEPARASAKRLTRRSLRARVQQANSRARR